MHEIVSDRTFAGLSTNAVRNGTGATTGKGGMLAATCLAGVLCFFHASAGAVQPLYVDEMFYDRYAMELAQWFISSDPVKFSYVHPSGYSFVLAFVFGMYYLVGHIVGQFPDLASFLVHFATRRGDFVFLARLVSGAFAVATVPFLYALTRRLFNERAALLASFTFAVSYPVIFYAHIAANITMLMFLTAASMYFIVRISEEDSPKNYILAGAFIGIAVGTKYYPILLLLPLLFAHFHREGWEHGWRGAGNLKRLSLAGLAIGLCAIVMFPLPLLAFDQWSYFIKDTFAYYTGGNVFRNAFKLLWGSVPHYAETAAEPSPWWSNSLRSWSETTLLWVAAGSLYAAFRFGRQFILLASPFLVMFLVQAIRGGLGLGVRQLYFAVPLLIVLASGTFVHFVDTPKLSLRWKKAFLIVGSIVLLVQPVSWAIRFLSLLSNPTTVELGRTWLLENIPRGSVLLCDGSAAPFGETEDWWRETPRNTFTLGGIEQRVHNARRQIAPFKVVSMKWKSSVTDCQSALSLGTPVYVVTTDYFFSHYWHPQTLDAWGNMRMSVAERMRAYVSEMSARMQPIHVIRPREANAFGPTITIARLNK